MNIKRDAEEKLKAWMESPARKPLIVQGARQVGKTWLLKDFGKRKFIDVAYFSFDEKPEIKQFFQSTKDVSRIIQNLSWVHRKPILPGKTLIILDEIQECNEALNSLKYFCENAPEYHVTTAGPIAIREGNPWKSNPDRASVGKAAFCPMRMKR